ncbi:MAG: helix-turn-helix transcriptional regulator, partial [Actinobacteria bacterium]|nr:helix-turn-helix transcriptional regulator [Actinomycetota bacterium]
MTSDPPRSTTPSAIGRTLGALGDEWSLLIVRAALWGANRFGEFRERLGISDSVLASRLGDLVDFEVLSVDETGCYRLTDSGEGLWRVLAAIWSWERGWVDGQDAALPEMWHRQCRQMIGLEVRCAACGQTAGWGDVSIGEVEPATFARLLPPGTRRRRRRRRAPSADPDPQGGDPLHRDPLRLDPLRLGQYQATMTLIGS